MWKQFPIFLDESCASIFRFTLKMEAMDYVVSHHVVFFSTIAAVFVSLSR